MKCVPGDVPGTPLSMLHLWSHFISTAAPWSCYCSPHYTDRETEAKRGLSHVLNVTLLVSDSNYKVGQKSDRNLRRRDSIWQRDQNIFLPEMPLWTEPWGVSGMSRQTGKERFHKKVTAQGKIGETGMYVASLLHLGFLLLVWWLISRVLARAGPSAWNNHSFVYYTCIYWVPAGPFLATHLTEASFFMIPQCRASSLWSFSDPSTQRWTLPLCAPGCPVFVCFSSGHTCAVRYRTDASARLSCFEDRNQALSLCSWPVWLSSECLLTWVSQHLHLAHGRFLVDICCSEMISIIKEINHAHIWLSFVTHLMESCLLRGRGKEGDVG